MNTDIKAIAHEFFKNKQKNQHLVVNTIDECEIESSTYCSVSEGQLSGLHSLKAKYGDKFKEHLAEVFTDEDELYDFCGCGQKVIDVDLDSPCNLYRFGICEIGPQDKVRRSSMLVELTDDEYEEFLCYHLEDRDFNVYALCHRNKDLHQKIVDAADFHHTDDFVYFIHAPYAITDDELLKDVETILSQHPEIIQRSGLGYV